MKKILLQTMPHTGTHTMHYLFNVLGNIPVIWHHWETGCLKDIEIVAGMDWKDLLFVRTYRNPEDTLESYKGRALTPEAGEEYFYECARICAHNQLRFPVPVAIQIDADNATKTRMAMEVFRRCGVEVPKAALDYMKSWKRIGSRHDEEQPDKAIKSSIHKGRVSIWHTK